MTAKTNRIFFKNNPYPLGHNIKAFVWSGRIEEDKSLWFDFHLQTDDYDAEDDSTDEDEPSSDWRAKVVWSNYQACTLSSTAWDESQKGISLPTDDGFDFDIFIKHAMQVDTLPFNTKKNPDDLSFNIYLLGHDTCANHNIKVSTKGDDFSIEWTGNIALTYAGEESFDYEFKAFINNVDFSGFEYPQHWSLDDATQAFKGVLVDFDNYEFIDLNPTNNIKQYKLIRKS